MNASSPFDGDDLEALLRKEARPALADDGFTARVMAALPARRDSRSQLRLTILGAAASAGLALAIAEGASLQPVVALCNGVLASEGFWVAAACAAATVAASILAEEPGIAL